MAGVASMGVQVLGELSRARRNCGVTQAQVAERMGVSLWHFCRIENGHRTPTLDQAFAWASAVGVTIIAQADKAQ